MLAPTRGPERRRPNPTAAAKERSPRELQVIEVERYPPPPSTLDGCAALSSGRLVRPPLRRSSAGHSRQPPRKGPATKRSAPSAALLTRSDKTLLVRCRPRQRA